MSSTLRTRYSTLLTRVHRCGGNDYGVGLKTEAEISYIVRERIDLTAWFNEKYFMDERIEVRARELAAGTSKEAQ
jgi:hypothetical protein